MASKTPTSGPWNPLAPVAFVMKSARRVLDCGCGGGVRAEALRARCAATLVGVEADSALLEQARAHFDEVLAAPRWYTPLPLEENAFDCVVCDGTLARVRDHETLLCELERVLAPGGLLIATLPNLGYYKTVCMLAGEGDWRSEEHGILARENLRFFTAQEIFAAMHRANLETKCAPLVEDPPESLPLDAANQIHYGRMILGPLEKDAYRTLRTQQFVALGVKKSA